MLRNITNMLTPRRPDGRRIAARIPEGERVYAIGDVHGRRDLLELLLETIRQDAQGYDGKVTLIGMGDYIDRGPDSKGVVDVLMSDALPAAWDKVFLRGNHEQVMLDFMQTAHLGERGARCEWLAWGGLQALESYGVAPFGAHGVRDVGALAAEFGETLNKTGHGAFFDATQLYHVCGDYLFVHAGVRRGIPVKNQMAEDLLYIREDFIGKPHDLPFRVVFGHTIMETPLVEDDRIGIDTGAFQSGILTAVRLEDDRTDLLQTNPKLTNPEEKTK
ncbi:MAG: serine/threonine protein phosphatase [Alphaproteobacteria bacterium]|nr:MAG: serine/threonine protein phosphatase [Alphaproteobacteria bacterium]